MRLLKLAAENFGLHTQVEFDFSDQTIIRGRNASGKSTLARAIVWCLFGTNLEGKSKEDKHLIRDGTKSMQVTTEWVTDNREPLHIVRIKPTDGPTSVMVNHRKAKPGEIEGWFFRKEIFLSIFNARHFGQLEPKDAKLVLADVLPDVELEDVRKRLAPDYQPILSHEVFGMGIDSVEFLATNLRKDIAEQEHALGRLMGTKDAYTETLACGPPKKPNVQLDKTAKEALERMREERRSMEYAWETRSRRLDELNTQLGQARQLYRLKKSALGKDVTTHCPTCHQSLSDDQMAVLRTTLEQNNEAIEVELRELQQQGKALTKEIEQFTNLAEPDTQTITAMIAQYTDLDMSDREALATFRAEHQVYQTALTNLKNVQKDMEETEAHITQLRTKLAACRQLAFEFVRVQNDKLDRLFDKVQIRLTRHNPDTGELIRDFRIEYNGKKFSSLSNSERIRCGIEIGRVLSTPRGESMPTFVDDAESVADLFSEPFSGQVIAAYMFDCELMVEPREQAERTLLEETKQLLYLLRKGA